MSFNRKRKGDFDDEDYYHDYRPRMPKRQRVPPVVQLCKEMMPDIRTIGESKKAFEDDIKFLSEAIANEYGHEDYFNNALLETLMAVVLEQPHKQPAIALLTMTVNSNNDVAGKSITNYFFEALQKACNDSIDENISFESNDTGVWNKVKLVLRFLSLLSPMLIKDDIINIYRSLFDLAIGLNNLESEKRNPLSEAIYNNTLLNIPYLFYFNMNDQELQSKVEDLVSFVESNYTVKSSNFDILNEYNGKAPYDLVELTQIVLPNIKKVLANNMEQLTHLFINWNNLLPDQSGDSGFNSPLVVPTIEQITEFSRLQGKTGSVDGMWKTPRSAFHVYLPHSSGEFDTVVPITTYAGQLFSDIIIDIVESLEFNRKEVAKQIISLDLFFKENIFAEQGESIAQLAATYEENPLTSTFKIEDLVVETILSLVFKLPNVSQPFAYFYSLLVDICQNNPKAIAPVFGRAFRFFYNNVENLDFELKLRFLDWFSIQMSNFNFSWKWNEWENDANQFNGSFYNSKIMFMKNLIRKELRLTASPVDVDDSLPDAFKKYLDTSFIPADELCLLYQSMFTNLVVNEDDVKGNDLFFKQELIPFESLVRDLLDYIHKQNNDRDISELEGIIAKIKEEHSSIISNFERFVVILITQCVVHSGSRSLSHANKYITDLKDEIKIIFDRLEMDQETKEFTIMEAVVGYWNSNSQNAFLIVDAFKYTGFVSPKTIYNFCFSEYKGKNYGLVDVTAIDSIFRTLSEELVSNSNSVDGTDFVFEKLCFIINQTIRDLNIQPNEVISIPVIASETTINPETELPRLDLLWKYTTSMSFVKSLLRKYSAQYKQLSGKYIENMDQAVPHEATREQLIKWVGEINDI